MRVGIVGGGYIAKLHGALVRQQPGCKIVGVADRDRARANVIAKELGGAQVFDDASTMLKQQEPDVVHILVPPHLHAELSILGMEHGCHVLVEKPMATTMEDARKMVACARANDVHLCPNHNQVFDAVIVRCRDLVQQGTVGRVVSAEVCYLFNVRRYQAIVEESAQYVHWSYRLNGGPLEDMMPHPASLLTDYLGEVVEAHSIGLNRGVLPAPWDDEVRVILRSDRVLGYLSLSLSERPDTIKLTVKGTSGTIDADMFTGTVMLRKQSPLPRAVARGVSGFQMAGQSFTGSVANVYRFLRGRLDKTSGLREVIDRFYGALREKGELPITPGTGMWIVDLMRRVWPEPVSETHLQPPVVKRSVAKASTALVTGASGFIGTHLISRLVTEGMGVRALARQNSPHAGRLRGVDVEVIEGDLGDVDAVNEACEGIKTVYHAGATLSNDWDEHERTNIGGTRNIVDAAVAAQVDRLVHVSTIAVYELRNGVQDGVIDEAAPFHKDPRSMGPYYYSKIECEKIVMDAWKERGLKATIVRPGLVIGPHGRLFFQQLGYQSQDKFFIRIGNGKNVLPLTYVENTVEAIYQASLSEKAIGQTYNLIDDGEITAKDYLQRFIDATGTHARIIVLPYIVPYLATAAYEICAALGLVPKGVTSRAQLAWKQARVRFDNSKANTDFPGWQVVGIEDGMRKTFQWYVD